MYTVVFLFGLYICIIDVCNRCIDVCIYLWCVRGCSYVGDVGRDYGLMCTTEFGTPIDVPNLNTFYKIQLHNHH